MISENADDPVLRNLALLRPLAPDPMRAERVRACCRARLGQPPSERPAAAGLARWLLAPLVIGLCALYIAGLVGIALRLRTLLDQTGP